MSIWSDNALEELNATSSDLLFVWPFLVSRLETEEHLFFRAWGIYWDRLASATSARQKGDLNGPVPESDPKKSTCLFDDRSLSSEYLLLGRRRNSCRDALGRVPRLLEVKIREARCQNRERPRNRRKTLSIAQLTSMIRCSSFGAPTYPPQRIKEGRTS